MENLTKESFIEKIQDFETNNEWKFKGELPCIIDFYADWCSPCKMIAPILQELSEEYKGKINIYKVDTEAEYELASLFNIRSIPSILFCPKEGEPQMSMGALPKDSFRKLIDELLIGKDVSDLTLNADTERNVIHQFTLNKFQKILLTTRKFDISNLYPYSKIRLKKSRNRKKFNKNPYKYLSEKVAEEYFGILITQSVSNIARQMTNLNLEQLSLIEPMTELPKGEIFYLDYQYNKNE